MDAPPVQYVKTSDWVNIAYCVFGDGAPLVFASNALGDVNLYNLPHPHTRQMTDELVRLGWGVVRYDIRGAGSSDREPPSLGLDSWVRDLEAVAAGLGARRVALAGVDLGSATAAAFASKHPENVSKLVLLNAFACGRRRLEASPEARALASIVQAMPGHQWNFATTAVGNLATRFDNPVHAREIGDLIRRSLSLDVHAWLNRAQATIDLAAELPKIAAPTLVVHDTGFPFGALALCREVAAGIHGARLVTIHGDAEAEIAAIDEFLREARPVEREPEPAKLTSREAQVLRLIAAGRTNREIAGELVLSVRTVGRHITNIYAKIGARSKAEATAYAFRHLVT